MSHSVKKGIGPEVHSLELNSVPHLVLHFFLKHQGRLTWHQHTHWFLTDDLDIQATRQTNAFQVPLHHLPAQLGPH